MDEADLRKKSETNVFAEFLSKAMPIGLASNVAPPPPPPTPQKMCRGTHDGNVGIGYRNPATTTD